VLVSHKYPIMAKTANTVLSDINEIMTGYFLAGKDWNMIGADARAQYNARAKQAEANEIADATAKAEAMAKEFLKWARANKYTGRITGVWWTARPGSMKAAVGYDVDQRKNPTDILVKFSSGPADGFLGLSAKATQGQGDIGFKNPGVGTVDKALGLSLGDEYAKKLQETIKAFSLPEGANERKAYIRANPGVKEKTEQIGVELLQKMRGIMLKKLESFSQEKLLKYILSDWMDAEVIKPPYIKVTGMGSKPPYTAAVMDPVKNDKLDALGSYEIVLEKVGNESIGICAGKKRIMKMRFKFESEKMASSLKMSGDPWK
jgi:hypothetical protein